MSREREFEWRPGRFKDLVLYISDQLRDDLTYGSTKLNKILYFSDTRAYRDLGEPITGAIYQRNHHGPTAVEYPPMLMELQGQNYLRVTRKKVVDHDQDVPAPTGEIVPNLDQFSVAERTIIDDTIAEFRAYNNTEASDESHKRVAGWVALNQGETIPYHMSLVSLDPVDDEAVDYFDRLEDLTSANS